MDVTFSDEDTSPRIVCAVTDIYVCWYWGKRQIGDSSLPTATLRSVVPLALFFLSCDFCMMAAPRSSSAEGLVNTSFFEKKNTELCTFDNVFY